MQKPASPREKNRLGAEGGCQLRHLKKICQYIKIIRGQLARGSEPCKSLLFGRGFLTLAFSQREVRPTNPDRSVPFSAEGQLPFTPALLQLPCSAFGPDQLIWERRSPQFASGEPGSSTNGRTKSILRAPKRSRGLNHGSAPQTDYIKMAPSCSVAQTLTCICRDSC